MKGRLKPMNRNYPHFAIPEIYGESLSYYELLRKLVKAMNVMIDNYNTIPDQISEAVANLDASQLFSAVLNQLIHSIATDNTKSTNAVKVYKKHDLLYATFNETVNLYESLIDFATGTETELIVGTNIREVNISELFIELRKMIGDEALARIQADTSLQSNIDNEARTREQADTSLQSNIDNEARTREQADATKVNTSDVLTLEEIQASTDLTGKIASASGLNYLINKTRSIYSLEKTLENPNGWYKIGEYTAHGWNTGHVMITANDSIYICNYGYDDGLKSYLIEKNGRTNIFAICSPYTSNSIGWKQVNGAVYLYIKLEQYRSISILSAGCEYESITIYDSPIYDSSVTSVNDLDYHI